MARWDATEPPTGPADPASRAPVAPAAARVSRRAVLGAGAAALAAVPFSARARAVVPRAGERDGHRGHGHPAPPVRSFGPVTLYAPPPGRPAPGTLYARAVRLGAGPGRRPGDRHDGERPRPLLATFEQYVTTARSSRSSAATTTGTPGTSRAAFTTP